MTRPDSTGPLYPQAADSTWRGIGVGVGELFLNCFNGTIAPALRPRLLWLRALPSPPTPTPENLVVSPKMALQEHVSPPEPHRCDQVMSARQNSLWPCVHAEEEMVGWSH